MTSGHRRPLALAMFAAAFAAPALLLFALALAAPADHDFNGERLTYEFGWQKISAATAAVSVDKIDIGGRPGYRIVLKLTSKPALDLLWRVRDVITSETFADTMRCNKFLFQQREASFYLDTTIRHDADRSLLIGSRVRIRKSDRQTFDDHQAPDDRLDPLGALLYVQLLEMAPGKEYDLQVFDGNRQHELTYSVLGEERVKIGLGEFDAWKVQPRIVHSSNPDQNSKVAKVQEVFMWVDKNSPHRVLRIESEAFVGRIYVELIQAS
jgi:hypothetical protein